MTIELILLFIGAYLVGSVPAAYVAAKWSCGIDLRKHGTGNVGAGNLLTVASKRIAVPAIIFDVIKGAAMVAAARLLGFDLVQQAAVGMAAVTGHNWSAFLRFSSGRGILTAAGVALVLPSVNGYWPWPLAVTVACILISVFVNRSTVLGLFIGGALMPIVSLAANDPLPLTIAYAIMPLIVVVRRLSAPTVVRVESVSRAQRFLNRLLLDRDIRNKKAWMDLLLSRTAAGQASSRMPDQKRKADM